MANMLTKKTETAPNKAGSGSRPATAADVAAMVSEKVGGIRAAAARATYIGTKMGDLPEAYQNQLPPTEDQAQLSLAESKIREQYQKDMRVRLPHGVKNIGGDLPPYTPGGKFAELGRQHAQSVAAASEPAPKPQNLDGMSAAQLFSLAIKNENGGGTIKPIQTQPQPFVQPHGQTISAVALIAAGLRGK